MSSPTAPNVSGVGAPGRRTVYSMCGMCAVRCPMEVTAQDGRVRSLQGNPHDTAIGASLCAKGCAFGGPGLHRLFVTTATGGLDRRAASRRARRRARVPLRNRCDRPARGAVPTRPRLVAEGCYVSSSCHREGQYECHTCDVTGADRNVRATSASPPAARGARSHPCR
jgi:hypothetical protein